MIILKSSILFFEMYLLFYLKNRLCAATAAATAIASAQPEEDLPLDESLGETKKKKKKKLSAISDILDAEDEDDIDSSPTKKKKKKKNIGDKISDLIQTDGKQAPFRI